MNEWKFLLSGGVIGLILSSVLVMVVLYRLSPLLHSRRGNSLRDQHGKMVPRFGGVALFWGFAFTILIVWLLPFEERGLGFNSLSENRFAGLCIGAFIAWVIGLCDDIFQLRARWKLAGQIGIAFLAISFGFEINLVQIPFLQVVDLGFWSLPLTVFWIVGVMNAVNLIDGLDGLSSGLCIIALSGMAIICWQMDQLPLLLLIIILIGVTLGFWTFNRPPATIFMGDSGSLFLGYMVALLSIWIPGIQAGTQSILPVLLLAVPILDTTVAVFRRLLKGVPFYSADNDHLHHRLIAKGFSPLLAMVILVLSAMLFGSLALIAFNLSYLQVYLFLAAIVLAYVFLYWLEYDVIREPLSTIWGQSEYKKNRNLMLALCEKIDEFFAKDPDEESIIRSFQYWTEIAGVSRIELRKEDFVVWQNGPEDLTHRILMFQHDKWEVRMSLPESSWKIDSDVKGNLLERVTMAFLIRLKQLESPVINLNKNGIRVQKN